MKQVKNFGLSGMKLMGFKPRSYLKLYHNIKHSYFIFPDDQKANGSSQVSHALILEMLRKDQVMIAKFIPRENS